MKAAGDLYARLKDFTMVDERTFALNLELAASVRDIPGVIVECGVWRGGMAAGLGAVLAPRRVVLLDSFQGLPPAQAIDGAAALGWQADTSAPGYHDNCKASSDDVRRAMAAAGVSDFEVRAGRVDEVLPPLVWLTPIALLRLDVDWHAATRVCLDYLFDKVAQGGLIIVDDYYVWDGCSRAVHEFLAARHAVERIRSYGGSVCYMVKV